MIKYKIYSRNFAKIKVPKELCKSVEEELRAHLPEDGQNLRDGLAISVDDVSDAMDDTNAEYNPMNPAHIFLRDVLESTKGQDIEEFLFHS